MSLYVHLPWCVSKCPYCDFNSHEARGPLPAGQYVSALLADLESGLPMIWGRPVVSVFFGGGTPSLFSADWIGRLLEGIRARLTLSPDAEITLEANPGTTERDSFAAYRDAGVNRISLGVQSFDDASLSRIGRIHGRADAENAIRGIRAAGFANFNLDLMYALPGQSAAAALGDIQRALEYEPAHISHYQLTLEPNTAFAANPPRLPAGDAAWEMQERCGDAMAGSGFSQYEISAWSTPGRRCLHNLNYWRFGDYFGIGAGAHGKITLPGENRVVRQARHRHPKAYLRAAETGGWIAEKRDLDEGERVFEFFLGQLRLREGVRKSEFTPRTGLSWQAASAPVSTALEKGLLEDDGGLLRPTDLGWRFVNETQQLFLPATP